MGKDHSPILAVINRFELACRNLLLLLKWEGGLSPWSALHFGPEGYFENYTVERLTIPHLNSLINGIKTLGEQLCCYIRGRHTTSSLKSVFFSRKVVWQPLIELQSSASDVLQPTAWDLFGEQLIIICLCSFSGSLSNLLGLKIGKVGIKLICNRV